MTRQLRHLASASILLALSLSGCSQLAASGDANVAGLPSPRETIDDPHGGSGGPLGSPQADPDMPVQVCGVEGTIEAAFIVPAATRYDEWVPGLTGATELDGKDGSLVLVYEGEATLANLSGIPGASRQFTHSGVVCVVTADGEPNVYTGIKRDGIIIPPGSSFLGPINDEAICERFPRGQR